MPATNETRRGIGVLGHSIGVYEELSALENLCLFARLYGMPDPTRTALEWLERTGLTVVRDGLVREFSRGMRQRLAVARTFLHDPSLLLLDEPFTALDDRAIAVLQASAEAAQSEGRSIIMSTHQLREALELATDVALVQSRKAGLPRAALAGNAGRSGLASTAITGKRKWAASFWIYARRSPSPARICARSGAPRKQSTRRCRSRSSFWCCSVSPSTPHGTGARYFGRPALARIHVRRRTGPESQLFARVAERLPRCASRLAHQRGQLWAGKALANYALLLAIEAASLPVFGIFYNVNLTRQLPLLALVMLLATWSVTIIGTTFSA